MVVKTAVTEKWSDIPDVWEKTKEVKKVSYKADPKDKDLISILSPFAGTDDLRPALTGIYFDKDAIVTTDAHRVFMLPNDGNIEGLYEIGSDKKIDAKFPEYKVVIPENSAISYQINILKLKTYLNAVINGEYMNKATYRVILKYLDAEGLIQYIAVNGSFLIEILESFERLGNSYVWIGLSGSTRGIMFATDSKDLANTKLALGKKPIALCMPLFLANDMDEYVKNQGFADDEDFGRNCFVGYDLSIDSIFDKDGTVVKDWMPKSDWGIPYWTEEECKVATMLTKSKRSKSLNILEYVKVENKVAVCSDLDTFYVIKNFDVQDGLYLIVNSALVNTKDNPEKYPQIPDYVFDKKHKFEFLGALDYASEFISDDDLRPAITGVNYRIDKGRVSIKSTDAHTGISFVDRYDSSEYPDLNVIIGNPHDVVKCLKTFEDINCEVSENNKWLKFTCEGHEVYSKVIDEKFPDMDSVLPIEFAKATYFDPNEVNKVLASIKGGDKKNRVYFKIEDKNTEIGVVEYGETKKIGEVSSKTVTLDAPFPVKANYMLGAYSLGDYWIDFKYDSIKTYFKAGSEIATKENRLGLLMNVGKLIFATDLNINFGELNRMIQPKAKKEKTVKPAKATKTKDSKPDDDGKREELEKAIKGLEMLAKKGNQIAENTLKGLKILLKRM